VDAHGRPSHLFGVVADESMVEHADRLGVALTKTLDRAHRAGLNNVSLDVDVMVDDNLLERTLIAVERNRRAFFKPAL